MAQETCTVYSLGRVEYLRALDLQRALGRLRAGGVVGDTLLLLEHPHVYTLGRRGRMEDVLLAPAALADLGVPVYEVDRGGEVTYHGPGQLVAYPVLDLRGRGGPVRYVRAIESAIVDALGVFGIAADRVPGFPGVWVKDGQARLGVPGGQDRKIAAIGVRISRGVTGHGLALNVNTDLGYFRHIVACGVPDLPVTSMARELGCDVDAAGVRRQVAEALGRSLGLATRWASAAETECLLQEGARQAAGTVA